MTITTDNGDDPLIDDVRVFGRGGSLFGREEGDHSAAHALFRDTIAGRLLRRPLRSAPGILFHLLHQFRALPGMARFDHLNEEHQRRIYELVQRATVLIEAAERLVDDAHAGAPAKVRSIQDAAQALLDFRNSIPLTAMEFGSTGGGERPLGRTEAELGYAAGWTLFRAPDGSSTLESGGAVSEVVSLPSPDAVLLRLVGLFDFRVLDQLPRPDEIDDISRYSLPGVSGVDDAAAYLEQFYVSVGLAYPRLLQFYRDRLGFDLMARLRDACQQRPQRDDGEYVPSGDESSSDASMDTSF